MMNPLLDPHFLFSILIGFCAQIVGSSLAMAYSVTCSSVLLAMGGPILYTGLMQPAIRP